jgi:hypothetical protein
VRVAMQHDRNEKHDECAWYPKEIQH